MSAFPSTEETAHRLTRAQALRAALADGKWHTGTELAKKVGHRFGAALLMVRRGEDGQPAWQVELSRERADGSLWAYRYVRELKPGEVGKGKSLKAQVWQLRDDLKKANEALERAHGALELARAVIFCPAVTVKRKYSKPCVRTEYGGRK